VSTVLLQNSYHSLTTLTVNFRRLSTLSSLFADLDAPDLDYLVPIHPFILPTSDATVDISWSLFLERLQQTRLRNLTVINFSCMPEDAFTVEMFELEKACVGVTLPNDIEILHCNRLLNAPDDSSDDLVVPSVERQNA
jgi:hypothetical protein